jgi:hypothetical protein
VDCADTLACDLLVVSAQAATPSIENVLLSHLTSTDARLEAQIDTEGLETTYQFKLWASPCGPECELIQNIPLPSGTLLGSFVDQSVSLDLGSAGVKLTPGGGYGYSLTATSSAGSVQGKWQSFKAPEEKADPLKGATSNGGGSDSEPGSQTAGPDSQTSGSDSQTSTPRGHSHRSIPRRSSPRPVVKRW